MAFVRFAALLATRRLASSSQGEEEDKRSFARYKIWWRDGGQGVTLAKGCLSASASPVSSLRDTSDPAIWHQHTSAKLRRGLTYCSQLLPRCAHHARGSSADVDNMFYQHFFQDLPLLLTSH